MLIRLQILKLYDTSSHCPGHGLFFSNQKSPPEDQKTTHFIAAVEKKDKLDVGFVVHDLHPALQVILVPREAVDKEAALVFVFLHGLLHRLEMTENERLE